MNIKNGRWSIINNNQTKEIQLFDFGLNVNGKVMPFLRAEGDRNSDDDPNYKGSKAIFLKPEFNRLIRYQRCLVLADAFVLATPEAIYLVYLRGKQRPFAFAGIWDVFKNKESGEKVYSFAIISTTANSMLLKLGIKRMPVILFREYENTWIRSSAQLSDILSMLSAFPANLMNAYPISNKIEDKNLNDISLVQPIGKPLFNENPIYKKTPRLGKADNENKIPLTLEQKVKAEKK